MSHHHKQHDQHQEANDLVREFTIHQIDGGNMGKVTGIPAGSTKHFRATTVPVGSSTKDAPRWASDNALATIVQDPSDPALVAVTAAPTLTGSFNLSVSANSSVGPVSGSVSVPVLAAVGIGGATGFDITQTD